MEFNDPPGDWPVTPITKSGKRPKLKETNDFQTIGLIQTTEEFCESLSITASTDPKSQAQTDVSIRSNAQPNFDFSRSQFPPVLQTPRTTATSVVELNESEKENRMFQSVSETCASHMYQTAASSPMRPVKTPRVSQLMNSWASRDGLSSCD
ncbi:unnamed protein product [Dicrocoelium dendriticum]|nr:unnamed protein product [Dicrocoelium dendriticum]